MTCRYDGMRVRATLSRAVVWMSVAATMTSAACAASLVGPTAEFSIVNASPVHLQHLYVSPCGARQWGPDQLAEPLPPSRLATVSGLPAGCYDVQFVVAPWNKCVIAGADLHGRMVWKVTLWTVFGAQSGDCSHIAGFVPTAPQRWRWPSEDGAIPLIRKD